MINFAQPNPAAWSPPVGGATAPVAPVAAIRPLQETARNGQPGAGRDQGATASRAEARAEGREAARLAREAARESGPGAAGRNGAAAGESGDLLARREAEQQTRQLAQEQAADEARRAQRQELLSNVWKASAAVVDRVLGREETANAKPGSASAEPSGRQPGEQLSLPWPVMPQDSRAEPARVNFPAPQEVVAYDERGNSNLAPMEAGLLLSRRV
jgi:hypothetical protein